MPMNRGSFISAPPTNAATLAEPARDVPVMASYDVVIAGGGIAGVAAAVAAARTGASVCLLEKACALGGLATLGNVTIWLPLCDGMGRQVSAGLAEEMLKLAVADLGRNYPAARFMGIPAGWQPGGAPEARQRDRYQVEFNPGAYLLALETWLVGAGVKLLYDTRVCAVHRAGERVTHLLVENKSGRSAMACRAVVDATGDADVCALAGETTESLDTNVLCGWFYYLHKGELNLVQLSKPYSPLATREGAKGPFFLGDNAEAVTAQLLGSRALLQDKLADIRAQHPGDDIQVIMPCTTACLRMTRRLVGRFALGERHMHQWFDDTIGLTGDWRKRGPVYAIPLRCLTAVRSSNLLVAGRCIAADTTVWDVTRAIPGCAVTGEAAGTAAGMAAQQTGGDVGALPVSALQQQLRTQGALQDPSLTRPA
jgi:2-polyprenyl-6-methoxyphenol hydroxylase-like FAD-dependent oxidoreductase